MNYRDLCTVCTTPQTSPSIPHFSCRIPRDLPGPAATHVRTQWIVCSAHSDGWLPRPSPELDLPRHLPEPTGSVRLSLGQPSTRTIYKCWAMPFPRHDETRGGRGRFNSLLFPHLPERGLLPARQDDRDTPPAATQRNSWVGSYPDYRPHRSAATTCSRHTTQRTEKSHAGGRLRPTGEGDTPAKI